MKRPRAQNMDLVYNERDIPTALDFMKELFSFLFRFAPGLAALAVGASAAAGLLGAALLALLNAGLAADGPDRVALGWRFAALCALLPLTRVAAQLLLTHLTQQGVYELRLRLSRGMLAAPLRHLEREGPSRLLAALTVDIEAMTAAFSNLPFLLMNLAIMICGAAYLFWLSLTVGSVFMSAVLFSVLLMLVGGAKLNRFFGLTRETQDVLYQRFDAIVHGAKEYKLSRPRRGRFLSRQLPAAAAAYRRHQLNAGVWFAGFGSLIQVAFFAVMGWLIFVAARGPNLPDATVVGCAAAMLFMWGPFDRLSTGLRTLFPAAISLRKIRGLGLSLGKAGAEPEAGEPRADWRSLELRGARCAYHLEREDRAFTLGPIDLSFTPGEIVFIVGGNGSGKTTLAKLIAGLYPPEAGELRLDGEPVTEANRDAYRQLFAAVFSDFHLFEDAADEDDRLDRQAADYLAKLHLDHKVRVQRGAFSTIALSQGQRKRLALLAAYLEDRPIYLFDEWAADQDPEFKRLFYEALLPELKARGKTVLVISHDDHYFHAADRIIKLDYGRIELDRRAAAD